MKKLNTIQFKAIRYCLGLRNSILTNVVVAEAGEDPLICKFDYLTSKYLLKPFSLDSHIGLDYFTYYTAYREKEIQKITSFF